MSYLLIANNVIENVFQYNTIKDYFGENQIGNEFKGNYALNDELKGYTLLTGMPLVKKIQAQDTLYMTADTIKIIKIDVDRNPSVAEMYQISGVPTLILFKSGKVLWRQSGVIPAHQLFGIIKSKIN